MELLVVFLAAVLSGMGVGSGGFYLLYLTDVLGVPQYAAQGANLLFFALATLASSLLHLGRGHITLGGILPLLLTGMLGTVGGSLLTLVVPASLARHAFGAVMIVGGVYTLWHRIRERRREKSEKGERKAS